MMTKRLFWLIAIMIALLTTRSHAQDVNTAAQQPFIPHSFTSPIYIWGPDAVTPYGLNPASLLFQFEGGQQSPTFEGDFQLTNFEHGSYGINFEMLMFQFEKRNALRITRFGTNGSSQLLGTPITMRATGTATEICYSRRLSDQFLIGAALNTQYTSFTSRGQDGTVLANGTATAKLPWRVGIQYQPAQNLSFGATYAQQHDHTMAQLQPALTGLDSTIEINNEYNSSLWMVSGYYSPRPGTNLTATYQAIRITSPGLNFRNNCVNYGVEQYLNKNWSVSVLVRDRLPAFTLSYNNAGSTYGGFTYWPNSFREYRDYMGRSNSYMFWFGTKF